MSSDDWVIDALCKEVDPETWFPEKGGSTADAKRICRACPVQVECLREAITIKARYGVWGGLSERELRQLTTRMNKEGRLEVTVADTRRGVSILREDRRAG